MDFAAGYAFSLGDDVTLDCRGHKISDATMSTASAVMGSGASNIAIRNCVFEGFSRPVWLQGAAHFRIQDNTFLKTMDTGIFVDGQEGLVSRNTFRYAATREHSAIYGRSGSVAIEAHGTIDIVDNTISAAAADRSAWGDRIGIWSAENEGGVIASNFIRGIVPGPDYMRYGIVAGGSVIIYRNDAVSTAAVQFDDVGISCEIGGTSFVLQNIVAGHAKSYLDCIGPDFR